MNVLSLFNGMSCGRIALGKAGIKVDRYYSSEVEPFAIAVANKNYPEDEKYNLGDVTKIDFTKLPHIDLIIGGSPCQGFSFAGSRPGMISKEKIEILSLDQYLHLKEQGFEFSGQSYLFWEYVRAIKELNPESFFLENVKLEKKWSSLFDSVMGVSGVDINSSLFSAQNRPRKYWTNIKFDMDIIPNTDVIYDILDADAKFDYNYAGWMLNKWGDKTRLDAFFNASGKASCLSASMAKGQKPSYCVNDLKQIHKFTATECERMQTIPAEFTSGVANSHRLHMLGNGWTVDVIAHIFKNLKQED